MPLLPSTPCLDQRVAGPMIAAAAGEDAAWCREPTPPSTCRGSALTCGDAAESVATAVGEARALEFALEVSTCWRSPPEVAALLRSPARHCAAPPPAAAGLHRLQPPLCGTASPGWAQITLAKRETFFSIYLGPVAQGHRALPGGSPTER
ncbi:hypothetical protein NDU88_005098 [Pleurodeles waltl]|uniref:Uncharacterized protein n=1 Tax=Pleurodeles waltl TaxID=8319 RepID=A0AAV7WTU5_PLEWA|nr:hypothetical protein NDU88_005098 [Pleurodeles waltl]